jgi:exodeoxyribonuclease VII small subunit
MVNKNDISKMEFEEALKELESVVKILEDGKISLKESVDLYERGILLKKHCDGILESTQFRINQISIGKDGSVGIEDFQE